MSGESRNEIHETDLAARRLVRECLPCYLPTRKPELILDIVSGFFDGTRSRRARPEINEPLDVSENFLARKFFPNLRLSHRRRFGAESREDEHKDERDERNESDVMQAPW